MPATPPKSRYARHTDKSTINVEMVLSWRTGMSCPIACQDRENVQLNFFQYSNIAYALTDPMGFSILMHHFAGVISYILVASSIDDSRLRELVLIVAASWGPAGVSRSRRCRYCVCGWGSSTRHDSCWSTCPLWPMFQSGSLFQQHRAGRLSSGSRVTTDYWTD